MKTATQWVGLAAALFLGSTSLAQAGEKKGGEKEENEVKMSIKEVPSGVRKTIQREAEGAKVKTVDKEKRDGKTIYEADAEIEGENYEIIVDKEGKLLSKILDDEESEKADKGEEKESKSAKSAKSDEDEHGDKVKKGKKDKEKEEDEDDEKPSKKKGKESKGKEHEDHEKGDKDEKGDKE